MPLNVSYMGTKRRLASAVAEVVALSPNGPMLDLFSGMCAVASAVTPNRQIWCNDVQHFAAEVSSAFFTSARRPIIESLIENVYNEYLRNRQALTARFALGKVLEEKALNSGDPNLIAKADGLAPNVAESRALEKEREILNHSPRKFPYRLFSITFSGAYFGLAQSIEIDSLKYAIDRMHDRRLIAVEQRRWMTLALCQAACKAANTTGHFAQFLKVKQSNVDRFIRQRRRSIWEEWQNAIRSFKPLGSGKWRRHNKTFRSDAIPLLQQLYREKQKPSVVYADPPYTYDHYSRFYHLYESLVRYDYPASAGIR